MSGQTKQYLPVAMGLVATVGAVAGFVVASFRLSCRNRHKGG